MRIYDWTMLWLAHGYSVVPVAYRSKNQIKATITDYHDKQPTTTELWRWFGGGNMYNYAVVMRNGLTVFDFDDTESWYEWQWWSFDQPTGSPAEILLNNALCVKTSRGFHLWFDLKEKGYSRRIGDKNFDIKRASVVLGPGSTHPSGSPYRAMNALNIPTIETLESILPPAWYEKLQNQPELEISGSAKMPTFSDDPFDVASNAVVYDEGVSLVQQVKERHKIQSFFTELVPSSNGYMMTKCPFHDDNNPSFWIDTKRQICNCNKCQFPRPLDVINLFAKIQGVDDKTALNILSNMA